MFYGPYVQEYFSELVKAANGKNQLQDKYDSIRKSIDETCKRRYDDLQSAYEAAKLVNIALEGCDHNSEAYRLARAMVDGTSAAKVSER